jgi:hypothetical protein
MNLWHFGGFLKRINPVIQKIGSNISNNDLNLCALLLIQTYQNRMNIHTIEVIE